MSTNKEYTNRMNKIVDLFVEKFDKPIDKFFSSSGRIELLGNHTDHNNGKCLVSAVNLDIIAATAKTNDGVITIYSDGFPVVAVDINDVEKKIEEQGKSIAIVRGVTSRFIQLGYKVGGFKACANSTIFPGSGVSSSAAYEELICGILNYYYNDNKIDPVEMAKIGQYAETQYFGKPCGLLDQMGVALGAVNYLDFKDLKEPVHKTIVVDLEKYHLVLTNTGGSHAKLTPYYSAIKDDMRKVANYFGKEVLREVDINVFKEATPKLFKKVGGRAVLRAIHYFEENNRVEEAYQALLNKDVETFLKKVNESGQSSYSLLQNCFYGKDAKQNVAFALETSKQELQKGAFRVHGGGFAGTILAFVAEDELKNYLKVMKKRFGYKNCVEVYLRDEGVTAFDYVK